MRKTRHNQWRDDQGFTLIEMIVSFLIVTVLVLMVGTVYAKSRDVQVTAERTDKAVALAQGVLAQAQQTAYTNLGYYSGDADYAAGAVTLPLWQTASGDIVDNPETCTGAGCPSKLVETQSDLGASRPAGALVFQPRVDLSHDVNGVKYRLDTWVTDTLDGSKRVTVQAEWPAADGTCTAEKVHCLTQSFVRAPLSSEQDPSGAAAPAACSAATGQICQTYVRSGRVMSGETYADLERFPRQSEDVLLFVRTTKPADAISATWSWKNLDDGSTTSVSLPSSSPTVAFAKIDGDATRWKAVVPADATASGGAENFKGWVRPGRVSVAFKATFGDGSTASASRDAEWSYTSQVPVTATVVGTPGTCSKTGPGTPTTVKVSGLSIGFGRYTTLGGGVVGSASQSADDSVSATFTVKQSGQIRTVEVPATLQTLTPVYQTVSDRVRGGWVDATFSITSPLDESCPDVSENAILTVNRTTDGTSTPFNLQLLPTYTPGPVTAPTAALSMSAVTGKTSASWTAVAQATAYVLEWSADGAPWPSEGGNVGDTETRTDLSIADWTTVPSGHSFRFRVAAIGPSGQSAWSNIAQVFRAPSAPVVSVTRSGLTQGTFTWTPVPGATSYMIGWTPDGGVVPAVNEPVPASQLSLVMTISHGDIGYLNVYAVGPGGVSAVGSAALSIPLFEPIGLKNGWVNYDGGYAPARFTRTSEGVIVISGLIRGGDPTDEVVIGQLPVGYRPNYRLIFTMTYGPDVIRVDVTPDGDILFMGSNGTSKAVTWISLSGITFLASDAPATRVPLNMSLAGWTNFGSVFSPLQAAVDGLGRVHVQGLVNAGITTNNAFIGDYPVNLKGDQYLHLPGWSAKGFQVVGSHTGVLAKGDNPAGTWTAIQAMFHVSANSAKWSNLPLQNGWVWYSPYASPQYQKSPDGIVMLRGLITGGAVPNGTVLTTLPAGCRPASIVTFDIANSGHPARVDVNPDGQVIVRESLDNGWVALEAINFVAEQ